MFLKGDKEELGAWSCQITDSLIYFTNINGVPGTVPAAADLGGTRKVISALLEFPFYLIDQVPDTSPTLSLTALPFTCPVLPVAASLQGL